jgi:radial spoke head protein 4/6
MVTEDMNSWSIHLSDVESKLVLAKSQIWPGAFSFANERTCDHIYIGYGHKYLPRNFSPPLIPQLANEFILEPGMKEYKDPIVG